MPTDLTQLKVSLTKNGYLKIADVLKRHPRWEVLDNIRGVYPGINLVRSQVANIMDEERTGEIPECWDEIRSFPDDSVDAFVFVAIVMSHVDLISVLRGSSQGDFKGYLRRSDLSDKAFTNLVYAMASVGACDYVRGAEAISYDLRSVVYHLRDAGSIVADLIASKLRRAGWRGQSNSTEFFNECESNGINDVFGIEPPRFRRWMRGTLRVQPPETTSRRPLR